MREKFWKSFFYIVESTYTSLLQYARFIIFPRLVILAPIFEIVEKVNDFVINLIPEEERECMSCDTICKWDEDVGINCRWITTEFINDFKCSSMSNHKLWLKVGVPLCYLQTLMYCLDFEMVHGWQLFRWWNVFCAHVVNGPHSGKRVYISRMNLIPWDANVTITFQRRQSSLCLCFAMTITKSQGQTLSNVGLYLSRHVFTHSQLYAVVSRVKTRWGFKDINNWL